MFVVTSKSLSQFSADKLRGFFLVPIFNLGVLLLILIKISISEMINFDRIIMALPEVDVVGMTERTRLNQNFS